MKRYVKKPIAIEAMQLTNESIQDVVDWIHGADTRAYWAGENNIVIETLEGDMLAREGDYVIRGIRGEFYSCKQDIFEETYEEVD